MNLVYTHLFKFDCETNALVYVNYARLHYTLKVDIVSFLSNVFLIDKFDNHCKPLISLHFNSKTTNLLMVTLHS